VDAEQLRLAAHADVLGGLRAGRSLGEIERDVLRRRSRGVFEPDLAMLELVIGALDYVGVSLEQPLDISHWRDRFLPEINFRNRHADVGRLVYALHTAAAFRTGLRPDILEDTYGWGGAVLLPYATRAAVMSIRAVSDGRELPEVCDQIAARLPQLKF
jgi:hypothetical protein